MRSSLENLCHEIRLQAMPEVYTFGVPEIIYAIKDYAYSINFAVTPGALVENFFSGVSNGISDSYSMLAKAPALFNNCTTNLFTPSIVSSKGASVVDDLLFSQINITSRLNNVTWPEAYDSAQLLQNIQASTHVITLAEFAASIVVHAALYRLMEIVATNANLRIQLVNCNPYLKTLATTSIACLPAACLYSVLGFTSWPLLFGSVFVNVASNLIPQRYHSIRNAFDETYLISSDKNNVIKSGAIVFLIGIFRGLATTAFYHQYMMSRYTDAAIIKVCDGAVKHHDSTTFSNIQITLIFSLWIQSMFYFDRFMAVLRNYDFIKDLRTPFFSLKVSATTYENVQPTVTEQLEDKSQIKESAQAASSAVHQSTAVSHCKQEKRGRKGAYAQQPKKTKTRPAVDAQDIADDEAQPTSQDTSVLREIITIPGFKSPVVKLYGDVQPNTWGIVDCNSVPVDFQQHFITSLNSGHVANHQAAMKRLNEEQFEIRPRSLGHRAVGSAVSGTGVYESLKGIIPLANAIAIDDEITRHADTVGHKHLVPFDDVKKHKEMEGARAGRSY